MQDHWKEILADLGIAALLFFVCIFLATHSVFDGMEWGDDFALYLSETRAILEGRVTECFADNLFTASESSNKLMGPTLYPWGFPILLLPLYAFFGFQILLFKVYIAFFLALAAIGTYFLFRSRLGKRQAFLIAALFCCNSSLFFECVNWVISDVPHFAFVVWSMVWIQTTIIDKRHILSKGFDYAVSGFLVFLSSLIHVRGIVLLMALFLSQLMSNIHPISKRPFYWIRKNLVEVTPYFIFFVGDALFYTILPRGSYKGALSLDAMLSSITFNLDYYSTLTQEFFGIDQSRWECYYYLLPFFLAGIICRFRRDFFYLIYASCLLGVLLFMPFRAGLRYVLPWLPIFLYFSVVGINQIGRLLSRRVNVPLDLSSIILSGLLIMMLYDANDLMQYMRSNGFYVFGPYTKESQEVFDYVRANTDPSDVIIFMKPRAMTYYTRRKSFQTNSVDGILDGRGDYYVQTKVVSEVDEEEELERSDRLQRVFENRLFIIYRIQT